MRLIALFGLFLMTMAGADALTGKWQLVELRGKLISGKQKTPFIQFTATGGRIEGSGGCNRFGGSFKRTRNNIQFGVLSATMMECLGPEMKIEEEFLKALSLKLTYKQERDELHLREGKSIVMRLKR